MKTLTKNAVLSAANLIIEAQDAATTLEIKGLLRELNFFATQAEVSALMAELADEDEFDFVDNGHHRIYMAVDLEDEDVEDDDDDEEADDEMVLNADVSRMRKAELEAEFDDEDMVVFDCHGYGPTSVYDGTYETNDIKSHYSKTNGTNYLDVRMRMVKNMVKKMTK